MRNTLKHLTLLTRMKDDGLLPALTGSFSEDAIAQACGQVETLQLQERLHISLSISRSEWWVVSMTSMGRSWSHSAPENG